MRVTVMAAAALFGASGEVGAGSDAWDRERARYAASRGMEAPRLEPPDHSAIAATATAIVEKTNIERTKHGLTPLSPSRLLAKAAQGYAEFMTRKRIYDGHESDGRGLVKRVNDTQYRFRVVGENIDCGGRCSAESKRNSRPEFTPAGQAKWHVDRWMNSPGHRANILNPKFSEIGVAVSYSSDGYMTTSVQVFGTRRTP